MNHLLLRWRVESHAKKPRPPPGLLCSALQEERIGVRGEERKEVAEESSL